MSFEKAKKYLQEKGYEDCSRQHRQQETLCQVGEKINSYKSMQYPPLLSNCGKCAIISAGKYLAPRRHKGDYGKNCVL